MANFCSHSTKYYSSVCITTSPKRQRCYFSKPLDSLSSAFRYTRSISRYLMRVVFSSQLICGCMPVEERLLRLIPHPPHLYTAAARAQIYPSSLPSSISSWTKRRMKQQTNCRLIRCSKALYPSCDGRARRYRSG